MSEQGKYSVCLSNYRGIYKFMPESSFSDIKSKIQKLFKVMAIYLVVDSF